MIRGALGDGCRHVQKRMLWNIREKIWIYLVSRRKVIGPGFISVKNGKPPRSFKNEFKIDEK